MDSDEDYIPPVSSRGPKRGRRPKISETKLKSVKRNKEKPPRKCPKAGGTPVKKLKPSPETAERFNSFSGEALTAEELGELLRKFERDGHFRPNPQNSSPAPLVVSRITDGKVVTTRIECYKPAKNLMRNLTETITSPKANDCQRSFLDDSNESSAIVFSNPVSITPGKKLNVDSTRRSFSQDKNTEVKKTIDFDRMSPDFASHLHQNLPNIPENSTSFAFPLNNETNIPKIPCSRSAFSFVVPTATQSSPMSSNNSFLSNPNAWNPPRPNNPSMENHQLSNTFDSYIPCNNIQQNEYDSSIAKRFDSNNSNDDPYGYLNPSSFQTINNQHDRTSFNSENLSFHSSNQTNVENSFSDGSSAEYNSLNSSDAKDPLMIPNNPLNGFSDNSMNFIIPDTNTYNQENGNANYYNCAMPLNINNGNSNPSGYSLSSFPPWNGGPMFSNNFTNGNFPYCNMYGVQNSAGFYDTSGVGIVNDQNNKINSSQNQVNEGTFFVNGNFDSSTMAPNLLDKEREMNINNSTLPNINGEALPNNEELSEAASILENFTQIQRDLDPNALSCVYDNGTKYDNFTEQNFDCNKENSIDIAQNDNFIANFFISTMNEERPMYNRENNFSQFYNETSVNSAHSTFYDFDTKKEVIGSSDCYTITRPSQC